MSVSARFHSLSGQWQGSSKLNLPWPPEDPKLLECESSLAVRLGRNEAYLCIDYHWTYEGDPQTGTMILAGDAEKSEASIGWSDSWHQSSSVLHLKGTMTESSVTCLGQYVVEGFDPFGWEISVSVGDDESLKIDMVNIDPEGGREWAVAGVYSRIQSS